MYDLNAFTPAQAADPSLPAELIAQLAAARPDLHAALLENPSMYPQLRQWIIDTNAQREPQFVYGSGVVAANGEFPSQPQADYFPIPGTDRAPQAQFSQQSEAPVPEQYASAQVQAPASVVGEAVDWSWAQPRQSGPLQDLEAFANGKRVREPGQGRGGSALVWGIGAFIALCAGVIAIVWSGVL